MTDSTSNPDEPDGHVATNDQQADRTTDQQSGTADTETAATAASSDADSGESPTAPAVDPEATVKLGDGNDRSTTDDQPPPPASEPAGDPVGAGDEPATGAGADPEPQGLPGDQYTIPTPQPPAARSDGDGQAADGVTAGSSSGPVPAPGSTASMPPPWNRVPSSAANGSADQQSETQSEVDRLLQEAPTAFIEPGADPNAVGRGSDRSDQATVPSRAWAAARAVRNRPPRQAILQLKRLDPWSILKLALVLAVVLFFIWLVAVGVLYGILDGMGVWDRLNGTYADLVSADGGADSGLITAGPVFGFAAVIGAINSLLFAVAMTVGAFVYNVSADLVGGIEVTLSERD